MNQKSKLIEEYNNLLLSFLENTQESDRQRAHRFGRKALDHDISLLEIIGIHNAVLSRTLNDAAPESSGIANSAADLLTRTLAAYETTLKNLSYDYTTLSFTISHDLRAPLRAITGFGQIILDDHSKDLSPEVNGLLTKIMSGADRMNQLIEGLLALSALARQELYLEEIDASAMVTEICEGLRRNCEGRIVHFRIASGAHLIGDRQLLHTAFTNLLANAWKFTANTVAAQIEFGVEAQESHHVYFIRDNGAGFDMRYIDQLFGVFQRLHSPEEFSGIGIGLAAVRRIIERHDGRIWAAAKVNQGATFYFSLPHAKLR